MQKDEIGLSHELYKKLLGKNISDTFTIRSNPFDTDEAIIKEIKTKYVSAFHDIINNYETRFPNENNFYGVDISEDNFVYINSVAFIRPDGIPVILVKFAAKYKGGDIKLEEGAFVDHAWVNAEEVGKYDCIQGIQEEVKTAIRFFS